MKVLVTGAAGFIGSHLCAELIRHGHEVRGLDLRWPEPVEPELRAAERVEGDVTSAERCREVAAGCEAIAHLAALVGDWGPRRRYLEVNVGGTRNLLGAARHAGARRVLLVSSVAVHHYRGLRDADESALRDGRLNGYCLSKIAAEDLLVAGDDDLEWTIARPGVFPFGPRDRTSFARVARAIERGRIGYVNGGRSLLTTAYVENLVGGLRLALESPRAAREVFVIGDEARVTWRELFGLIARELGVPPPRLSLPLALAYPAAAVQEGTYRLLGVRRMPALTRYRVLLAGRDCHFVSRKARELLGYRPAVALEEAVRRTVAWYRTLE